MTVDDQAVFRAAARDVIEATPGFESVGEACSCEEALEVIGRAEPRLVLVDVRMPGIDGIETAMRIRDSHPDVVVVLISIEEISRAPVERRRLGRGRARAQAGLRPGHAARALGQPRFSDD